MICNECFGVTFGRFSGAADYCANSSMRVFGHCFSGQPTALGGVVSNSPEPEIGWG